jgi:hypothetical protein
MLLPSLTLYGRALYFGGRLTGSIVCAIKARHRHTYSWQDASGLALRSTLTLSSSSIVGSKVPFSTDIGGLVSTPVAFRIRHIEKVIRFADGLFVIQWYWSFDTREGPRSIARMEMGGFVAGVTCKMQPTPGRWQRNAGIATA